MSSELNIEAILRIISKRAIEKTGPPETRMVIVVAGNYQQCLEWARKTQTDFKRVRYGSSERQFHGVGEQHYCGYVRVGTWYNHPLFRRGHGWNLLRMLESRGVPDLSRNPRIDGL